MSQEILYVIRGGNAQDNYSLMFNLVHDLCGMKNLSDAVMYFGYNLAYKAHKKAADPHIWVNEKISDLKQYVGTKAEIARRASILKAHGQNPRSDDDYHELERMKRSYESDTIFMDFYSDFLDFEPRVELKARIYDQQYFEQGDEGIYLHCMLPIIYQSAETIKTALFKFDVRFFEDYIEVIIQNHDVCDCTICSDQGYSPEVMNAFYNHVGNIVQFFCTKHADYITE